MLGINDPWIWGVYLLSILSTLICIVYGMLNWNKGYEVDDSEISEEIIWEEQEDIMQKEEPGL